DGRGDASAGRVAELDRGGADPAGSAVYEQVLAMLELRLGEDRVVGRGENPRHATGLGPAEVVGNRHQDPLVDDSQLRLAAAGDDAHHPIAALEAAPGRVRAPHLPP